VKSALAAVALAAMAMTQAPRTLEDVVRESAIVPRPALPRELQTLDVVPGAASTDDRGDIYAWWTLQHNRYDALHVFAIERATGRWNHREVKADTLEQQGSVMAISTSARFIAVEMHLNPSAASTLVYTRALAHVGTLYGWIKTRLPNEFMVYENSEVHFAPTHYVELSVYDPAAARTRQIYPPPHVSRVRQEFTVVVQQRWAALGEKWLRDHNHHGNATRFENGTQGEIVVDWPQGLAFRVVYRDEPWPDVAGIDPISLEVIVTCDGLTSFASLACREMKASDWEQRFPGVDRDGLLSRAAAQPRLVPWQ
jgi:hypothetical protein